MVLFDAIREVLAAGGNPVAGKKLADRRAPGQGNLLVAARDCVKHQVT